MRTTKKAFADSSNEKIGASFFPALGQTTDEVISMDANKSTVSRFKNDNRANPSLVIDHILSEVEFHIEKMTGKKVKLTAREIGS